MAKKHALKACHVLCGMEHEGDSLHATLEGDEDTKQSRRTRLIVRNLPWNCTEETFQELFHKFGTVTEVKIPKKEDGRMRGFGFVQFTHGHESAKAIKGVTEINGRKVAIDWCLPREVYQEERVIENRNAALKEEKEESSDEEMEVESQSLPDVKEDSGDDEKFEETDSEAEPEDSEPEPEVKPVVKPKTKISETGADVLEGRSVFLRNIPFDAQDSEIKEMCEPYGEVVRVTVVRNEAGVAKGVAFIEFKRKDEADQCVVNSKELNLNGRPIFARTSLPQSNINEMKKQKDEIKTAKNDKRNLTLAREGEIREGTAAWTGISQPDRERRERMAKERYEKLKNYENFIDPTKVIVHNIPKSWTEEDVALLCRKAANGDITKSVAQRQKQIDTIHLMLDKAKADIKDRSRGFAFIKFKSETDALKCLRTLNNHPSAFFGDKRPIVEFAVENSKALKILEDRKERNKKRIELRKEVDGEEPKVFKKSNKRPWQLAKEERRKKRRAEARAAKTGEEGGAEDGDKMEGIVSQTAEIQTAENPKQQKIEKPKHVNKPLVKKAVQKENPEYAGIQVQKGMAGNLKRPKHTGVKIRARDKGKITVQRQLESKLKRKQNLKKLTAGMDKEKIVKKVQKKTKVDQKDAMDKLVNNYKSKISAGLKLL